MPKKGESGTTVRSSHLGYDCYKTGSINGSAGRVRVILRAIRLPPSVSEDQKAILPVEMWWPQQDHSGAHALVDAVLSCDAASLRQWQNAWPDHLFGFERYVEWLERRAAGKRAGSAVTGRVGKLSPIMLTRFPATVTTVDPVSTSDLNNGLRLKTAVVRFADGQSALRLTLYALPHCFGIDDPSLPPEKLSRAYVDLIDGAFDIIEHYPGRYRAAGIPERTIYDLIGIRPIKLRRRVSGANRPVATELDQTPEGEQRPKMPVKERQEAAEQFFDAFPTKGPKERTVTLVGSK